VRLARVVGNDAKQNDDSSSSVRALGKRFSRFSEPERYAASWNMDERRCNE
jgi:hypothetical protein